MVKLPFSVLSSKGFITSPSIYYSSRTIRSVSHQIPQLKSHMETENYTFGPYKINHKEVFYSSNLSYAMVNLRPLLPVPAYPTEENSHFYSSNGQCSTAHHALRSIALKGLARIHTVLVCPRREVKRFVDLTDVETSDLWIIAQKVGKQLEYHHKVSSLTFAIQDGPQAGQTVPHVHIHIIPRKVGDFEKNDEIYEAIDEKEKELKQTLDLDKERKDRTLEEMAQEAEAYRKLFYRHNMLRRHPGSFFF